MFKNTVPLAMLLAFLSLRATFARPVALLSTERCMPICNCHNRPAYTLQKGPVSADSCLLEHAIFRHVGDKCHSFLSVDDGSSLVTLKI